MPFSCRNGVTFLNTMSARSLLFWTTAVFFALSGAMLMVEGTERVTSLEQGLGPKVEVLPL